MLLPRPASLNCTLVTYTRLPKNTSRDRSRVTPNRSVQNRPTGDRSRSAHTRQSPRRLRCPPHTHGPEPLTCLSRAPTLPQDGSTPWRAANPQLPKMHLRATRQTDRCPPERARPTCHKMIFSLFSLRRASGRRFRPRVTTSERARPPCRKLICPASRLSPQTPQLDKMPFPAPP